MGTGVKQRCSHKELKLERKRLNEGICRANVLQVE